MKEFRVKQNVAASLANYAGYNLYLVTHREKKNGYFSDVEQYLVTRERLAFNSTVNALDGTEVQPVVGSVPPPYNNKKVEVYRPEAAMADRIKLRQIERAPIPRPKDPDEAKSYTYHDGLYVFIGERKSDQGYQTELVKVFTEVAYGCNEEIPMAELGFMSSKSGLSGGRYQAGYTHDRSMYDARVLQAFGLRVKPPRRG